MKLFIFCGLDDNDECLSSIELLDTQSGNGQLTWQLFEPEDFTARYLPLVCPIKSD